ncbi:FAD-dependent monooxygenase [Kutzneria albida]|uniref:FAD-binding domain-containing protein n=1 Tax=Kutzneria albida DSM 43870 TaxID=1449976 RepID=W5WL87_9PSEU|nr:FAD-dependent monooxygenase [Kutzneria albida]AHI01979.1 hypothetical protein KALB_8622 [Kutzneria albida DSM 43870]
MAVLVAGAGPTGLVLACALLQRGVEVRVLDAAPEPARTSRALGLQARGVEILTRLGALGDLLERGLPVARVRVHLGGRQISEMRVGAAGGRGVIISQAEIEAALRRRLSELGGKVEWGLAVTDAEQDAEQVRVTVNGAEAVQADWLVGCDGAHSRVRKLAGIEFPGVPVIERFLLADVRVDLGHAHDGATTWLHRDGVFAAFALPGEHLWRLMADLPGSEEVTDVLAELQRVLPVRTGLTGVRLDRAEWTSTFRIQRRLASTYRRGRVLLAGDAAHIHSPFGGQGMNTGMGDAENLGWKLSLVQRGLAGESLLDTYQAERRPVAEGVLSTTTAATELLLATDPVRRLLRDHAVLPLMNLPAVQNRIVRQASQLDLTYRGGPLAPRTRFGAGPRLGDRVPSMCCARADGSLTSLHAELAGRWALVVGKGRPTPRVDRLGADLVVLHGDQPDTLLVRPDAHLAWREHRSAARLDAWLDNMLMRS